ncbi:hypothetical protein NI17_009275 [Thermobifida halotolerans]|uniref:Uncharacterized protein n=2 Tax=Thermobifida halotolerans TaxID=483545 RepID=A0A399FXF1_9ACTN|nr:hypothetical protein [Thermobifida halotolerans]UOE21296.1 hypothetical protein NI17_009275 [Thermobifida halotolerans]
MALSDLDGVMMAPVHVFVCVAAGSGYHHGQPRVTLAAVPGRLRLYTAKLAGLLAMTVPNAVAVATPAVVPQEASAPIAVELLRW